MTRYRRVPVVTPDMEATMRVLAARGESQRLIARRLGVGLSTVSNHLREDGRRAKPYPEPEEQAKTAVGPESGTNSRFPILERLQLAERRVADLLRAADLLQASAPDEAARLCELAQATEPEPLTDVEKEYLTYAETYR